MEVTYSSDGSWSAKQEVPDRKGAFRFLGAMQELLNGGKCGNCGGVDHRPLYRRIKEYDFYSLQCQGCGWELKFGQRKEDGQLFPKAWEAPYEQQGGGENQDADIAF